MKILNFIAELFWGMLALLFLLAVSIIQWCIGKSRK
jgi:hypothetical protein